MTTNIAFLEGDPVEVTSTYLNEGRPFTAVVTGYHASGFYVRPVGHVPGVREPKVYVTADEVRAIPREEKPKLAVNMTARLGSKDGPPITVLALTTKGPLVVVHTDEFGDHVMLVSGDDVVQG